MIFFYLGSEKNYYWFDGYIQNIIYCGINWSDTTELCEIWPNEDLLRAN